MYRLVCRRCKGKTIILHVQNEERQNIVIEATICPLSSEISKCFNNFAYEMMTTSRQ